MNADDDVTWWSALTDPVMALDGWVGAALGAVVSVVVAIVVLRRTLAHDRERARVDRQVAAFADVLWAVQSLVENPASIEHVKRVTSRVIIRCEIWAMSCASGEAEFAVLFPKAFDRAAEAMLAGLRPVKHERVDAAIGMLADVVHRGRIWHTDADRRKDTEAWFGAFLREHPPLSGRE